MCVKYLHVVPIRGLPPVTSFEILGFFFHKKMTAVLELVAILLFFPYASHFRNHMYIINCIFESLNEGKL